MEMLVATVNFVVKDLKADLYVELTHMLMPSQDRDEGYFSDSSVESWDSACMDPYAMLDSDHSY
jgi:hypothetical protein